MLLAKTRLDGSPIETIATPPPYPPDYGTVGDPSPDGAYTTYGWPSASRE